MADSDVTRRLTRPRVARSEMLLIVLGALPGQGEAQVQFPPQRIPAAEITVTAQRRPEMMQDVPIGITAYSAAAISELGAVDLSQIAEFAPNVTFDATSPLSGGSNSASVFIRGVGQSDFTISSDPGVALYVDGVNLSRSVGSVADLTDVERVEILRGPQGTLFGRNAVGGAISVIRNAPIINQFSVSVEVTAGNRNWRDLQMAANIPLGTQWAIRFAGVHRMRGGYASRILMNDRLGGLKNYALRGAAKWQHGQAIDLIISADFAHGNDQPPASTLRSGSRTAGLGNPETIFSGRLYNNLIADQNGVAPCQRAGSTPFCGLPGLIEFPALPPSTPRFDTRWVTGDLRTTFATGKRRSLYQASGIMATGSFRFGSTELKSIAAYRHIKAGMNRDGDNSPLQMIETANRIEHEQISDELQLSGSADALKWLAGAYFLSERGSDAATAAFAEETFQALRRSGLGCTLYPAVTGAPTPIPVSVCPNIFYISYSGKGVLTRARSLAGYAEINKSIADGLSLTAGGRWTYDRKNIDISGFTVGGYPVATSPRATYSGHQFTPRLVFDWRMTDQSMVYGSWSTSYKAGGFNQRYGAPISRPTSFEPERLQNWEAGFKTDWLSTRARLNGAVFTAKYRNIQTVVFDNGIPRTINAARGRITGAELEGMLKLLDGLSLEASYGWIHARYTKLDPAIVGSFGTPILNPLHRQYRFVNTPRHNFSIGAAYRHARRGGAAITARLDMVYRSTVANDAVNTPELMQSPIALINARITHVGKNDQWALALFCTNLTNRRYITSGAADEIGFGGVEVNVARPREFGLSMSAKL